MIEEDKTIQTFSPSEGQTIPEEEPAEAENAVLTQRETADPAQPEDAGPAQPEDTEQDDNTVEGALEAILFAMGDSVELTALAKAVGRTPAATKALLQKMQTEKYDRPESGISLLELDDSWQLCTKKQYYAQLTALAKQPKKPQLTDAVLETLSIIAYKQPVTKAEIEKIRGVSCDHAVSRLVEYGLVQELGRLQVPGRPILFGTTEKFLRYFGVKSTDELPQLSEIQIEDFRAEAEAEMNQKVDI